MNSSSKTLPFSPLTSHQVYFQLSKVQAFQSERRESSSVITGVPVCTHGVWVIAYFCVCISPYIIHIHAWWHKTISLFSSLMFICLENYHHGFTAPLPPAETEDLKPIVSHVGKSCMDCLRQTAHLDCKSDIHESFLK